MTLATFLLSLFTHSNDLDPLKGDFPLPLHTQVPQAPTFAIFAVD